MGACEVQDRNDDSWRYEIGNLKDLLKISRQSVSDQLNDVFGILGKVKE